MINPHVKGVQEGECKNIILHHSWEYIQENIKPLLDNIREIDNEDYPLLLGFYKTKKVMVVCTRMGIEESVNVMDQLINLGAENFIKLGSFVALNKLIKIGDIYIPNEAVRLPGIIDAILDKFERVYADKDMVNRIQKKANEKGIEINIGGKILTCPIYGFYIRDESVDERYTINFWKNKCFGDEMECSGVFAISRARSVRSSAILICNREYEVLDNNRKKIRVDWNKHKDSISEDYDKANKRAVLLALETIIQI